VTQAGCPARSSSAGQRQAAHGASAAVPDRGTLFVVEEGPLAGAVASILAGEEAEEGLDPENCAIVFFLRPMLIVMEEQEADAF